MSRVSDLGAVATRALLRELATTPKPGLVDRENNGAHRDLSYGRLEASAHALMPTFAAIAASARGELPSLALREHLGELGRRGERDMLRASGGTNTHRGAIWALGLLTAAAVAPGERTARRIARHAGELARMHDRFAPLTASHGRAVARRFAAGGARGEAASGFGNVIAIALPALRRGEPLSDVFLRLVATVDDTCVLHRGGLPALALAKRGARRALHAGGSRTGAGVASIRALERALLTHNASPGGCADLLAAALFLDDVAD